MSAVLLDTHVLIWWLSAPERLSPAARACLEAPTGDVFLSAVTTAELAIKSSIGRLTLPSPVLQFVTDAMRLDGLSSLAFEHVHAAALATLPLHHRDPFDRMLVAQALTGPDSGVVSRLETCVASA